MSDATIVRRRIEGDVHPCRVWQQIEGMDKDDKRRIEIRGKDFSYHLTGVPDGDYELTIGLLEDEFDESGKRVFSLESGGRSVLENLDIFAEAGGKFRMIERSAKVSARDGRLSLRFLASEGHAKWSYLRLQSDSAALEDSAAKATRLAEQSDPPGNTYETVISRFGSRYCFVPRPQARSIYHSPVGRYWDRAASMVLGAREGDIFRALPFAEGMPEFADVTQSITMSTLSYTASDPELPFKVTYSFVSPFYPEDEKVTLAPFFYFDVTVENMTGRAATGEVVLGFPHSPGDAVEQGAIDGFDGFLVSSTFMGRNTQEAILMKPTAPGPISSRSVHLDRQVEAWSQSTAAAEKDQKDRRILDVQPELHLAGAILNFTLDPGERRTERFVLACWTDDPILKVLGEEYRFKYTKLFRNLPDVIEYAFAEEKDIRRKTEIYDRTVLDASISQDAKDFISFSFQSLAMNAFYCVSPAGDDWFSVWEGCCQFHSTVDVEYNYGLWYYQYWPRLLEMLFDAWPKFRKPGIISHDMGVGENVNEMAYSHDMEVEENTNYLLMLYHYWKTTGNFAPVERNWNAIKEIVDYCIKADTNGNGFANIGTANTVDQGSPAVQYASEQTYLAVRTLAALDCVIDLAREIGDESQIPAMKDIIGRINRTLAGEAWLGDHYAVCLGSDKRKPADHPQEESAESESGAEERVQGWDAYSIYANNGLLYPFRSGKTVDIDMVRIKEDLINATEKTMDKYGCPHTTMERNMWVSQNIWRDMAAAYLGLDYIDNMSRYWALELYMNREKAGCFTDVYIYDTDEILLDYYPRGITAIGILNALAGMQIDAKERQISFAPIRLPLRIPLTFAADWHKGIVPWAIFKEKDGQPALRLENEELLEGWTLWLR